MISGLDSEHGKHFSHSQLEENYLIVILCFVDRASLYNHWHIKPIKCTYFLVHLFSLLYMFRTSINLSSGELTVSMRHWYLSLCMGDCPDIHPYTVTNTNVS